MAGVRVRCTKCGGAEGESGFPIDFRVRFIHGPSLPGVDGGSQKDREAAACAALVEGVQLVKKWESGGISGAFWVLLGRVFWQTKVGLLPGISRMEGEKFFLAGVCSRGGDRPTKLTFFVSK